MSRVSRGQEIELPITTLAFGGRGLGRLDDFVVFVDGALPGDVVRAVVTRVKKRHAEARLEEVLSASPDRRSAACRHFGTCGGCRWQSLDYEVQLRFKSQQVGDALERLGGLGDFNLSPIRGMDDPWRYRNKVEFSIGPGTDGPAVGFHPPGRWDQVLPLSECLLLPKATEAVRTTVEEWLREMGAVPWNARERRGYARHLTVREAYGTGELLVSLVTAPGPLPGSADRPSGGPVGLVERLRERHPQIVGVLHAENDGPAELASGIPYQTLWGRPYILETMGSLELKISIDAFFQTNTRMAEVLYEVAADAAGLTGHEVVWDLYSGIGSIGLYLANRARMIGGIELVPSAVADARENAGRNGIEHVSFIQGDVRVVLKEVLERRRTLPAELTRPHVVVVDPPRAGLAHKVIARVAALRPERIVYVSCNPATLAPNAALFAQAGYGLTEVTPVDMFPHTPHIEAVALLRPAAH